MTNIDAMNETSVLSAKNPGTCQPKAEHGFRHGSLANGAMRPANLPKITESKTAAPKSTENSKNLVLKKANFKKVSHSNILPPVPNHYSNYGLFKRTFDLVGASSLLVATLPVMLATAAAIRLSSPGPILLRQKRLTEGGRTFSMYKFRSMQVDAEKKSGPVLAKENDDRITRVGRFLRKTRLDELPQLLNVINNDMSLIGPRPERPEIAAELRKEIPYFDRRLNAKAGLSGLAQVKMGYSSTATTYRKKLALDRLYIMKSSPELDLWISVRTVWTMLTGNGAR